MIFNLGLPEIDKQTNLDTRSVQVVDDLGDVFRYKRFRRLQFNYHFTFNHDIREELPDGLPAKLHVQWHFASCFKPFLSQSYHQRVLIHRFQEAATQLIRDLKARFQNLACNVSMQER